MSMPNYKQDMPPPGGFEPVRYKRSLPIRGPSGAVIFASVLGLCTFGFYRVYHGNLEKKELNREKAWSRIHLIPMLLAEQDRDLYRREVAALEREKEIMKDVEGWEPGKSVWNNEEHRKPPKSIVIM
ncbi:GRIM-19 [Atractiella rhizophila]|nr:GRIM-19 [Atractiella rhizophila]